MVCRLMPAARGTSASVIADQSRLPSSSRIASSTESRRRARDASAYGTLRICATLTPLAPLLCIAALDMVALYATAPLVSPASGWGSPQPRSGEGACPHIALLLCIVAGGHDRHVRDVESRTSRNTSPIIRKASTVSARAPAG